MKYALLIGIDIYDRSFYGDGNDLKYCEYDVNRILPFFDRYDEVTRLVNSDARKKTIIDNIIRLSLISNQGDSVFIYQSSHGTSWHDGTMQASGLCAFDGIFADFEVYELLKKFKAGVSLKMAFDTCHSESNHRVADIGYVSKYMAIDPSSIIIQSKPMPTNRPINGFKFKSFVHMSACDYDSYSYELQTGSELGGVFTTGICNALSDNVSITVKKAFSAAKKHCKGRQTPHINYIGGLSTLNSQLI